jgi:TetR/AcrR family tetracycline transcriptional repressor
MPRALTSRRERASQLSRDDVIDAAGRIVAEGGYEALNMRALAERCDVAITTIYRLIGTKEQLLGGLADRLLVDVADPRSPMSGSWEEDVLTIFRTANRVLREHPELAEIVARQHTNGQVGFATAERTILALQQAGLDGERAAIAFNALVAYTIGFTQRQLYTTATSMGERWALAQELPDREFANVHAQSQILIARPTDEQFERGLKAIIHGFARGLDG